jgi:uncharacterized membrane protein
MTKWKKPFRWLQWCFAVIGGLLAGIPMLSLLFGFFPIVLIEILVFDNTPDQGKGY